MDKSIENMRALANATSAQMAPENEIIMKSMFGGVGIYGRGRMFAVIIQDGMAVKLDEVGREELIAEGGYFWQMGPQQVSKQYVVVPDHLLQPAALQPWFERSIAYAITLPVKQKRSRRPQS